MLDERIVKLASKTVNPQLRDLDQRLAFGAEAIRRKLHGQGSMFVYLMQLYQQEVMRRADIIWRNLHRAHNAMGAPLTDTLRADLVGAFRGDVDAVMQGLWPRFDKDMAGAPKLTKEPDWVSQLDAARENELARYEAEIDHYVTSLETASSRGRAPAASYVFHGHVGAVVTGANAVTNVVQNIGAAEREGLRKALEVVKEAIAQAPELEGRPGQELSELADDAAAEIAKESPNTQRLMITLQTLAAAVQGIASAPGAYEALRAAAAIGIQI